MNRPRKPRTLSEAEHALWQSVARTVKPARGRTRAQPAVQSEEAEPSTTRSKAAAAPEALTTVSRRVEARAKKIAPVTEIDRRTKRKIARGDHPIDDRIDLHGMTQAQAHHALARFLARAHAGGARYVLVVTGKGGRGEGERGILRRQVPLWLELPEMRHFVVGYDAAHIGHGGEGALYIRLRKARGR